MTLQQNRDQEELLPYAVDKTLKINLDEIEKSLYKDWDCILAVDGYEGCITGDTIIRCNRANLRKKYTIKELYNHYHNNPDDLPYSKYSYQWDMNIPTHVRSYDDKLKEIKLHKIKNVVYSGKKQVYQLILEDGKTLKATPEHKILTNNGYVELIKLDKNEHIIICDNIPKRKTKFVQIKEIIQLGIEDTYDIQCEEPYHNFNANDIIIHNSGKSTVALQMAHYIDRSFNLSRVCFTSEEFINCIVNAKKYQSVVYDEARSGLNARRALSEVNVALTNMLAEIRQKNLFVVIVLPSFFDLDKNVACWRSRALVHVYTRGLKERGFFKFYSQNKKKMLYVLGKRTYQYSKVICDFHGRFSDINPLDEQAYRLKKKENLEKFGFMGKQTSNKYEPAKIREEESMRILYNLLSFGRLTKKDMSEIMGFSVAVLSSRIKKIQDNYDLFKQNLDNVRDNEGELALFEKMNNVNASKKIANFDITGIVDKSTGNIVPNPNSHFLPKPERNIVPNSMLSLPSGNPLNTNQVLSPSSSNTPPPQKNSELYKPLNTPDEIIINKQEDLYKSRENHIKTPENIYKSQFYGQKSPESSNFLPEATPNTAIMGTPVGNNHINNDDNKQSLQTPEQKQQNENTPQQNYEQSLERGGNLFQTHNKNVLNIIQRTPPPIPDTNPQLKKAFIDLLKENPEKEYSNEELSSHPTL